MQASDLATESAKPDQSFGWQKKMRKTDEFSSVFHFRFIYAQDFLDFLMAPNYLGYSRLGLIVPKKIIPTAVRRNYIKRSIREAFRLNQTELDGFDLIARVKKMVDKPNLAQVLQSDIQSCKALLASRNYLSVERNVKKP